MTNPTPTMTPEAQRIAYRLVKEGEPILATDEILRDDCVTWEPIGAAWPVGCGYGTNFFVPMRRVVENEAEND